ncbi:hypothetical protein [Alishewanella tabrizica]|uniref:Uncharacterized protein n=1 Tax=Alishewanella tabrizica TaxID=671278 RepID=A0ABQ2WUT1_9ALTE|nr:hypothetical protein [Alishewanella tabrizica]GGW72087.1 hypothetical protein GCM10008111_30340 [Alishewanella tabrizica]
MRYGLLALSCILLASPWVYSQQQYTESACILLEHQAKRFSQDPFGRIYQESKYQLETYCSNPIPRPIDVANFVPDNQIRTVRPISPPPALTLKQMMAAETSPVVAATPLATSEKSASAAVMGPMPDETASVFDNKQNVLAIPLVVLLGFILLRSIMRRQS